MKGISSSLEHLKDPHEKFCSFSGCYIELQAVLDWKGSLEVFYFSLVIKAGLTWETGFDRP